MEFEKMVSIFIKLSEFTTNQGILFNGTDTIWAYLKDQDLNEYTWFSTSLPTNGIAKERLELFNQLSSLNKLKIYFVLNDEDTPVNDIEYTADILQIYSSSNTDFYPFGNKKVGPKEFYKDGGNRTWIKICNLHKERQLKAIDFIIESSSNNLKDVITKGQSSFGYIIPSLFRRADP